MNSHRRICSAINEQELFTRALSLAEKRGKSIHLAVAPATEKWEGILRAAQNLQSSTIALGLSSWRAIDGRGPHRGPGLGGAAGTEAQFNSRNLLAGRQGEVFYLGPHAPRLTSKEIDLLHGLWLELSNEVAPEELHHHDVVHIALEELQQGYPERPARGNRRRAAPTPQADSRSAQLGFVGCAGLSGTLSSETLCKSTVPPGPSDKPHSPILNRACYSCRQVLAGHWGKGLDKHLSIL